MKKEFTKEEKKEYYKRLRDRWNTAKSYASEDEIKAIISNYGLNISIRGYCFVAMQMKELGLEGLPYLDMKTFQGWKENGFMVQKGQRSQVTGLTWINADKKDNGNGDNTENEEKTHSFVMPKAYHLFHRTQVQEIS